MKLNIIVRKPKLDDYAVMADILVSGWRAAYRGIVDDAYLQNLSAERLRTRMIENKKNDQFLLAEVNGEVVGFCRYALQFASSEQGDCDGSISELYIKPELKRMGIGKVLFAHVMDDFKNNGNTSVILGCFSQNHPSLAFYEKMNGEFVRERDIEIGGKAYATTFYRYVFSL